MFWRNNSKRCGLLLLLSLMIMVFGLWGCDSGDDGGGVNYGHDFTVTITDSANAALAGLTTANVTVTTESGTVGTIAVDNTTGVITFSVDGITRGQNYVTLDVLRATFVPLVRRYLCTVTAKTDISGDNFRSALMTIVEVGATADADAQESGSVAPGAPISVTGLNAGTGTAAGSTFTVDVNFPAGVIFNTIGGAATTDNINMIATLHQGSTGQEPYYPGGSYGGDAPPAFGSISFVGDPSGNSLTPTTNAQVTLANLTFEQANAESTAAFSDADFAAAIINNTYACIIDVSTGRTVEVSGCSYNTDTDTYTCANGYYTFSAGDAVGVYRLEGGECPTTTTEE